MHCHFIGLDVLISCHDLTLPANIRDISTEAFEKHLQLTLVSNYELTRMALPHLEKNESSHIVFLGGGVTIRPIKDFAVCTATKAALEHFAKSIALDEAKNGINVNVVSPGYVATPAYQPWLGPHSLDELREKFKDMQPKGRMAEPEEIANVIEFVVSKKNTFMTGSVVLCDGGWSIQ